MKVTLSNIKKANKGITLIALIITIIVLLILAGVSIATLTGENGLLPKATKAKEQTKKVEYKEILEIIGLGLQPSRVTENWDNQTYMNIYEEQIKGDQAFKKAQEIKQLSNTEEITIQVITEEGWIYWVTVDKVEYKEFVPPEEPEPEKEPTDLYVSLNGTTLTFFDNEQDALNYADSPEHAYGNIKGEVFTRGWQKPPNTPWINDASKIQTINFGTEVVPTNMGCYFSDLTALTKIENIQNLKTEKVEGMYALFYNCSSLETIDLSTFDTSNVQTMNAMFYNCSKLKNINLSKFDTSNVVSMNSMFSTCKSLTTLNLSEFDTSKVTDMGYMFQICENLQSITFPENMDTSNVTFMREMFTNCSSLKTLDLSKFNTANVTNMLAMFRNCNSLTSLDVSSFNTEKVTEMKNMFTYCSSLTSLDLSSFNTVNVTNMNKMFKNCSSLKELNCSNFEILSTAYIGDMFKDCSALQKLNISKFNLENHTGTHDFAFLNVPNNTEITTNQKMKTWLLANYNFTNIQTID